MNTATIGYKRDAGDFQVLCCLNNKDDVILEDDFIRLVYLLVDKYKTFLPEHDIVALNREDCPDYVALD